MAFFSIIIPTYNRARFLKGTINSVLAQDFGDFEILVIDDGSTDNTKVFVQEKYPEERRLTYHYKENGERGAARNYGIKLAKGKYLVFLDSDDLMHKDYLSTLFSCIKKNRQVLFFAPKFQFVRNGAIYSHRSFTNLKEGLYGIDIVLRGNPLACNFCVKNEPGKFFLFPENRDLSIMEDWLFLLQNLVKNQLYLIDKITLSMNDHDERSMRKDYLQVIHKRLKAIDWIERSLFLEKEQIKEIRGYSYYFCSIHYFIGLNKIQSKNYLFKAATEVGWNLLFVKQYLKINLVNILSTRLK